MTEFEIAVSVIPEAIGDSSEALPGLGLTALSTTAASAASTIAAAATATTVASSTTAAAIATTAASFFARPGFIHGQGSPIVFLFIEAGNGCLRFIIGSHFDKPKALAAAAITIADDLCTLHRTELGKQLF